MTILECRSLSLDPVVLGLEDFALKQAPDRLGRLTRENAGSAQIRVTL